MTTANFGRVRIRRAEPMSLWRTANTLGRDEYSTLQYAKIGAYGGASALFRLELTGERPRTFKVHLRGIPSFPAYSIGYSNFYGERTLDTALEDFTEYLCADGKAELWPEHAERSDPTPARTFASRFDKDGNKYVMTPEEIELFRRQFASILADFEYWPLFERREADGETRLFSDISFPLKKRGRIKDAALAALGELSRKQIHNQ